MTIKVTGWLIYPSLQQPPQFDPQPVASTWFAPLSEPTSNLRAKLSAGFLVASMAMAVLPPPQVASEVITEDKWHFAWSEPVRIQPRTSYFEYQAFDVLDVTQLPGDSYESTYHFPWSEPVRLNPRTTEFQAYTSGYSEFIEPGDSYESTWHFPWSEPVRVKPRATEFQPLLAHIPFIEDFGIETKWYQAWSEPVRSKARATEFQAFTAPATITTEFITEDKWHYSWSEPVRTKLRTIEFQALVHVPFVEDQGIVTKWHQSWSVPSVLKKNLHASQQDHVADSPFFEVTDNNESKWHYPWSEPVRIRARSAIFDAFTGPVTTSVEVITEDKWHQAWSGPVRSKPSVRPGTEQYQAFDPNPFVKIDWFSSLAVPSKLSPGRSIEFQAFTSGYAARIEPGNSYESTYHYPWSEPVRVRPRTAEFQAFTFGQVPIVQTPDRWWGPLSEPVRVKPGLLTGTHLTTVLAIQPPTVSAGSWYIPLSEPVRVRFLGTQHFPAFAGTVSPIIQVTYFSRGYIIC